MEIKYFIYILIYLLIGFGIHYTTKIGKTKTAEDYGEFFTDLFLFLPIFICMLLGNIVFKIKEKYKEWNK